MGYLVKKAMDEGLYAGGMKGIWAFAAPRVTARTQSIWIAVSFGGLDG